MRWVGIDEAGYGPNLGPLVMTAVVAEGADERAPDLWGDLPSAVARAGGDPERVWIDDSKAIYKAGKGRDRLDAACLAALAAAGRVRPATLGSLLAAVEAGTLADAEVAPWIDDDDPAWPRPESRELHERYEALGPFRDAPWRIVTVHSVVVGPARFNALLEQTGSKAKVHFSAFSRLLRSLWERARDGLATHVRCDKHGGRHFYLEALLDHLEDVWIDRGPEGPELSRYTVRSPGRRLELTIAPRADAGDGLVALASIVSKAVREAWMDAFNSHWTARLPDLRPTAGYPTDAHRFREAIEPECKARGLHPSLWWRAR